MTRMMLDSSRSSLDSGKPRKDNRRETWCPGAGGHAACLWLAC